MFPKLAQLFEKSILNLMNAGEETKDEASASNEMLLNAIAENKTTQATHLINEGKANIEKLVSVAPIVKTSTLDECQRDWKNST
ncbi:hypothetical protein KDN24_23700 [Bacillus sp. Bva_UNVM-123]|uniref:hypothetical protein n=1 Tax=Bacillus sp. Bva_UNVM-123 TaxID=2829798 RepID=UPI00391EF3C2